MFASVFDLIRNPTVRTSAWTIRTVAAALLLSSCGTVAPTRSGFLDGRDSLAGDSRSDPTYVKPGLDASRYDAFLVEPVEYRRAAGGSGDGPSREAVARLTSAYDRSLITAFSERLRRADRPGPGVLRVRAAVTDVKAANPLLNAAMIGGKGIALARGGGATEAEVLDSVTGERLAALAGYNNGGLSLMGDGSEQFTTYGDAQAAFKVQAEKLRDLVIPSPSLGDRLRQAVSR